MRVPGARIQSGTCEATQPLGQHAHRAGRLGLEIPQPRPLRAVEGTVVARSRLPPHYGYPWARLMARAPSGSITGSRGSTVKAHRPHPSAAAVAGTSGAGRPVCRLPADRVCSWSSRDLARGGPGVVLRRERHGQRSPRTRSPRGDQPTLGPPLPWSALCPELQPSTVVVSAADGVRSMIPRAFPDRLPCRYLSRFQAPGRARRPGDGSTP